MPRAEPFAAFVARLEAALREPLPGEAAQARLAPRRRPLRSVNPARIRNAAGLLLLFPREARPIIVLTVRAHTLERHGGQVSLPGGVVEPGETFAHAALREAHEEIGLAPHMVRELGALTPIDITVSGFRLHPIVAAAMKPPALAPADHEVARILEIPLDELSDPARLVTVERLRDGAATPVPAIRAGGEDIWGATAMVLAEFLEIAAGARGRGSHPRPHSA